MHADWSKSILLWCSLATLTGCWTAHIHGDPAKMLGHRPGQENSEAAPGQNSTSEQSKGDSTSPGDSASESSDKSGSAQAASVPALGTAHTVQRAPADANSEAAYQAKREETETDDQEQALMEVVAELEALGELDPETKRQLIADLRETKPALWQPMLSIYRLALAKHKQGAADPRGNASLSQEMIADHGASSERAIDRSLEMHAAATAMASKGSPPARQPRAAPAAELPLPDEQLATRPTPLRPSIGSPSQTAEPEQSDYEVQSAQYQNSPDQYDSQSSLSLRQQDRAVRLASASAAERRLSHKNGSSASVKTDTKNVAATSRDEDLADWRAYLAESIKLLEEDSEGPARTAEEVRREAELRLLYLAAGDREAALQPIEGISTTQQEFWAESLFALATYLDAESLPDGPRRAAEARRHLEAAVTRLGELSTLGVRNLAFCSKVNSYGIYETYPEDVFEPGQQVLLYAELENFKCEETPAGFVTAVRSSYQIFDARGVRVESHDFATTEETCRNRRHDFFMRYFIDMPERIYDGEYTLKITIEDMHGQTSGEATIPFKIREHKQ